MSAVPLGQLAQQALFCSHFPSLIPIQLARTALVCKDRAADLAAEVMWIKAGKGTWAEAAEPQLLHAIAKLT